MAHEEHKIAQDGEDQRQDKARWRQDAKHEGCPERFGSSREAGGRPTGQQAGETGCRGGPPLRVGTPLPASRPKPLFRYKNDENARDVL